MNYDEKRKKALSVLGFSESFSPTKDQLHDAYKHNAMKFHPDRNKDINSSLKFIKIISAYDFLERGGNGKELERKEENEFPDKDENGFLYNHAGEVYRFIRKWVDIPLDNRKKWQSKICV